MSNQRIKLKTFCDMCLNIGVQFDIKYNWNYAEEKYMKKIEDVNIKDLPDRMLNAVVFDWFIVNEDIVEIGIDYEE